MRMMRVVRNLQWGDPMEMAGGIWGSGGEAPSRQRHGVLGAEPLPHKSLVFCGKNNLILGLF